MRNQTFAECFCAKYQVPREKYARAVFNRVLYRRTHLFRGLLKAFVPGYFAADFDLIYGVENLKRLREFVSEVDRFNDHVANHGWMRRTFCLRVSTSRLKNLIRETMPARASQTSPGLPGAEDESMVPFAAKTSRGR